jgi:hypothetical protein
MAIGFPTKANWAAGDVLTASALDDLAGTVNLLSNASAASGSILVSNVAGTSFTYQGSMAAARNAIINGGMDIWARGTSFNVAAAASTFGADRWLIGADSGTPFTYSQVASGLTTFTYAMKTQRTATSTSTSNSNMIYAVESANSLPFVNTPITISFYAKKGANFSGTGLRARVVSSTGTDQSAISISAWTGYSAFIDQTTTAANLSTSWTRYSFTATPSTSTTQLGVWLTWAGVGTAGADDSLFITGVQVEIGSVATTFTRTGGNLQGELAACQRYYYRANWDAKAAYPVFAQGGGYSTTSARLTMPLPVNMRVQPTAIDTSALANMRVQSFNDGTSIAPSSIALESNFTTTTMGFLNVGVSSGLTANALYYLRGENSTAYYIGWSAEL